MKSPPTVETNKSRKTSLLSTPLRENRKPRPRESMESGELSPRNPEGPLPKPLIPQARPQKDLVLSKQSYGSSPSIMLMTKFASSFLF